MMLSILILVTDIIQGMGSFVKTGFVCLMTALVVLSQIDQAVSEFRVIPNRSGNFITLECRSLNDTSSITNPRFWLNRVDSRNEIRSLGIEVRESRFNTALSFLITQEYEGRYFCGENLLRHSSEGNSEELIGKCFILYVWLKTVVLVSWLTIVCMCVLQAGSGSILQENMRRGSVPSSPPPK